MISLNKSYPNTILCGMKGCWNISILETEELLRCCCLVPIFYNKNNNLAKSVDMDWQNPLTFEMCTLQMF